MSAGISISIGVGVCADIGDLVVDPDAQAFIIAAGITNPLQITAINSLVMQLKAANVWTFLQAIYPIVGGTAATHKYNLKNPLDTDAAFRLNFTGGWTHAATGMTPNGTTGFADTNFDPNSDLLSYTSGTMGFYSRTANATDGVDLGATSAPADIYLRPASATLTFIYGRQPVSIIGVVIPTDGFISMTRATTTVWNAYRNGFNVGGEFSLIHPAVVSDTFYLGARNNGGVADLFSDRELAFGVIGSRLNNTQNLDLYTAIQNYQTTLVRQV